MIWRYYLYNFMGSFLFFSAVLVPFLTDWGNLSLFQVQLLQSWFAVWVFILDVPSGIIADKLGRKYTIALGCMVFAFGLILYGSFPSFPNFLLSEFILAVGLALVSGADEALLYEFLKEQGFENNSKKIFWSGKFL